MMEQQAVIDQAVDYIEVEVQSDVFARSTLESRYRLLVYRRGVPITLLKGTFFADVLTRLQQQRIFI
jgi:hypothetical protein